jgi:biotin transport system substrate-specific component
MQSEHRRLVHIAFFAAILAVSAQVRIPLGVVPLTLQSAAACIIGYALGPIHGAAATILYTVIGLTGIPVFATGGGPAYVLYPTFGYIIGFTCCAVTTGLCARLNRSGSAVAAYAVMCAGLVALYLPGLAWLAVSLRWIAPLPTSMTHILQLGLLIPLPGDLLVLLPAAALAVRLRKILA